MSDLIKIQYNEKQWESNKIEMSHFQVLVELWQEAYGLSVDGMCGPATIASIEKEMSPTAWFTSIGLQALDIAITCIGKGEEGGNNSGPFVEGLHQKEFDGDDDDDGAWCAAFVSTCFEQAVERLGIPMPFIRSAGAKDLFYNIGKAGMFVSIPNVRPGDVVCWDRGKKGSWQGHIGFVEGYEQSTGILHTIEGNVGKYPSKVKRFIHDTTIDDRLEGFARV